MPDTVLEAITALPYKSTFFIHNSVRIFRCRSINNLYCPMLAATQTQDKKGNCPLRGTCTSVRHIVRPFCTTTRFEILATVSLNSRGLFTTSAPALSLTISMHHGAARDIQACHTMRLAHQTTHSNPVIHFSQTRIRVARYPYEKLVAGKSQAPQRMRTPPVLHLFLAVTNI